MPLDLRPGTSAPRLEAVVRDGKDQLDTWLAQLTLGATSEYPSCWPMVVWGTQRA